MSLYSDKTGYEPEELHEMMKNKYLSPKQLEVGTEKATVSASTRKLDKAEFAAYMDKVERWGIQTLAVWLEQ